MAAETWFDAADALAQGFADRLIEPVRIAARFDIGRFRNAPPELVEAVGGREDVRPPNGPVPAEGQSGAGIVANDDRQYRGRRCRPSRRHVDGGQRRRSSSRGHGCRRRHDSSPSDPIPPAVAAQRAPIPPPSAPRPSPMPAPSSISAASRASRRWPGGSSNRTPVSTTSASPFWRQKPRPNPRSPPITRNPAGARQPVPGARSSPAPSS